MLQNRYVFRLNILDMLHIYLKMYHYYFYERQREKKDISKKILEK